MKRLIQKDKYIILFICFFIWIFLLIGLNKTPNLWFDEAWSLMVAKSWVQNGVYGRQLVGQFISANGMAQPITSTAWIALSFKLFGVGLWQARLPFTLITAASIFFLFKITYMLFGKRAAYLSVFVTIFLTNPEFQLLWYGRQAIAEAPLVLYLLAGYFFFRKSFKNKALIILAILFWGFAFNAKGQALPFLSIGLLIPILISINKKDWKVMRLFLSALLGALIVYFILLSIEIRLENGLATYGKMEDLIKTVALVTNFQVHMWTIYYLLVFGTLSIVSLFWETKKIKRVNNSWGRNNVDFYIRVSIYIMLSSWLIWFVFLSIGWPRYFVPIFFISCIFQGHLLDNGIEFFKTFTPRIIKKSTYIILFSLLGLFLIQMNIRSGISLYQNGFREKQELEDVLSYLEEHTELNEVIETYDAEIVYFTNNLSHYPPDQIQLELNKRIYLFEENSIEYYLSDTIHDYIIIGPMSNRWKLYESIIKQDNYHKIFENQFYLIYKNLSNIPN